MKPPAAEHALLHGEGAVALARERELESAWGRGAGPARGALAPRAGPLGRGLNGHGNNGRDGHEGVRRANVIGTYLHGPLLPKNAWFADWLIGTALALASPLEPLHDELERAAYAEARRAAGA